MHLLCTVHLVVPQSVFRQKLKQMFAPFVQQPMYANVKMCKLSLCYCPSVSPLATFMEHVPEFIQFFLLQHQTFSTMLSLPLM